MPTNDQQFNYTDIASFKSEIILWIQSQSIFHSLFPKFIVDWKNLPVGKSEVEAEVEKWNYTFEIKCECY